jgi:hypothetical protein
MNLVAKIRSLQAQVDELRARLDCSSSGDDHIALIKECITQSLPAPIAVADPIASATIAPPPAKRRGRPPKPKV